MTDQPITPPKRRNWFVRHPKTSIFLAFILAIAIGLFAFDTIAKRRLAARIDAIRAKSEPTCVEDLVKLKRPGPNSLPEVLALAEKIAKAPLGKNTNKLHIVGTALRNKTGCRVPQEEIDTMRWYLDQVTSERTAMHEAMRRSRGTLDIPWGTTREFFDSQLASSLSAFRTAIRVHLLEALYAAEIADSKQAGELLIEHRYYLEAFGGDTLLLAMLHQIASQSAFLDQLERTINLCGLARSDLEMLQQVLASLDSIPCFSSVVCAERVFFLGNLIPFSAAEDGVLLPIGAPGVLALDTSVGLDGFSIYIEACETIRLGLAGTFRSIQAEHASMPWYSMISKAVIVALDGAAIQSVRIVGIKRAMLVALAGERYRLDHNRWPTAASDLVPKYLAAFPRDPVDDKPIRYAVIPEGIKVWTINGDDSDQDNGGDLQRLEQADCCTRSNDHGWLLLNPALRGRACTPTTTAPTSTTQPRS